MFLKLTSQSHVFHPGPRTTLKAVIVNYMTYLKHRLTLLITELFTAITIKKKTQHSDVVRFKLAIFFRVFFIYVFFRTFVLRVRQAANVVTANDYRICFVLSYVRVFKCPSRPSPYFNLITTCVVSCVFSRRARPAFFSYIYTFVLRVRTPNLDRAHIET